MSQTTGLLLSLLFEVPVVLGIALAMGWLQRKDLLRFIAIACACTLVTHPFAWHGFAALRELIPPYWPRALVIEGGVAIVEGLIYGWLVPLGFVRGQALGWSANAFSYGLGLVIFAVFYP